MKNKALIGFACVIGGTASAGMAAPTLFVTSGTDMYRIQLDDPSSGASFTQFDHFTMDASLVSLTADDQGRLWGTEVNDTNGDGNHALYSIDNALSVPTLNNEGDFLSERTGSIVWANGSLYGFEGATRQFIQIDPATDSSTVIGTFAEGVASPASSGWDSATNAFYGVRNEELFRFNMGEELGSVKVADLNFGMSGPIGGEIIDGIYYHAINDGEAMHIFSIDLLSGVTTELIAFEVSGRAPVGFAGVGTVPAPGALALLGAGGLVGLRRKR
ncbi:MAG: hypothetical protein ACWA5W_10540 [Phycisphaerales bacterium]